MTFKLPRRQLLQAASATMVLALPRWAAAEEHHFEPQAGAWRTFDMTLSVEVADPQGTTRLWLPVPDIDTEFQRTLSHEWTGNASNARLVSDQRTGTRMFYAEFAPGVTKPVLSLSSRVQTRDRSVAWDTQRKISEDPDVLREALAPTELLPLDGIVKRTALEVTRGAHSDLDKTRAIYDWVIAKAHREPKVRGCGEGDIRTMLETGNLGGKCADLNAVFVGLCRAAGVPARDLYGIRVAPSRFAYRELGANPAKLSGAQHCRSEVWLREHGWVAMDPADVLKVMRQETPAWITNRQDPLIAPVARGLFGNWEGNWVAYSRAQDLRLPGSAAKDTLPFLMYPQGENASGRFDELAPDSFKYQIMSKEHIA